MAVENFSTYTEQDVGGYLTVTPTKATALNDSGLQDTLLSYDKGANHFDALDIDFEIYVADGGANVYGIGGIAITNNVQDQSGLASTDIALIGQDRGGTNVGWIRLMLGVWEVNDYYAGLVNTLYYCTMTRAAGNNTVTVDIWTTSDRSGVPEDTLTVAGVGTEKYQYSMGFINEGTNGYIFSGYTQNLDLNEAAPPPAVGGRQNFLSLLGVS